MACYTQLSEKDIAFITQQYAIQNVKSLKLLKGGSENSNYLLQTSNNNYVITICEQNNKEEAGLLVELLEYLAHNQFKTSSIVRSQLDEPFILFDSKPVIVKRFIEGKIIEDLPNSLLTYIGKEMGKLHKIPAPSFLPAKLSYGIEHFDELNTYAPDSQFHNWLKTTELYLRPYLKNDLPKSLIHSDLFSNNVIISENNNNATIMDFEEASNFERVFDIGMAIVGLCSLNEKIDQEKVTHFLNGYRQMIHLLPEENDAIQAFTVYAAAATAFWRHRQYHHIAPDATMTSHHLEMCNIADFAREMDKLVISY